MSQNITKLYNKKWDFYSKWMLKFSKTFFFILKHTHIHTKYTSEDTTKPLAMPHAILNLTSHLSEYILWNTTLFSEIKEEKSHRSPT